MRAAKNLTKRMPALPLAAAISAGSGRCVVVILHGGVSWVTTREPLEVVIYPDSASDRVEQLGGCVA